MQAGDGVAGSRSSIPKPNQWKRRLRAAERAGDTPMLLERAGALIPCLPVLAIPAWSVWRLVRGLRAGDWRRPGWFGHAAWASFAIAAMAWIWGALSTPGLRTFDEVCAIRHHQPFDEAYYRAHRDDYFRLFPLTSKCNAGYDLVPAWVNPTVIVFTLLFLVSTAGLGWATAHRLSQTSTKKKGSMSNAREGRRRTGRG